MTRNWHVLRSEAAKADLFEIWSYIAAHDIDAADRWLERIEVAMTRLSNYPGLGSARPELPDSIYAFSLYPHMILYAQDIKQEQVRIVRVIDARRDFGSLFT